MKRNPDPSDKAPEAERPWDSVPLYEGRDLARADLWELSLALAQSKRALARHPPRLPRARRASVSLLAVAVTSLTPSLALAHARGGAAATGGARVELALGDSGERVRAVQEALGIPADGIFGPGTRNAVRVFQKRHGLAVDGIVGPTTWAALAAAGSANGQVVQLGDHGASVTRLQEALGVPADGIFGPLTLRAVKAFQREQGLEVDGLAGPRTLAALSTPGEAGGGGTLKRGDRGPAVVALQLALGVPADGIFGPGTLRAVRTFQARTGLAVDGVVGPATRSRLAAGGAPSDAGATSDHSHEQPAEDSARSDVDPRLAEALALAARMGLEVISAHRPGATIAASGNRSDHSYLPSKAIDLHGTKEQMAAYARAVTDTAGVETVIYSPLGIWLTGRGWGQIRTAATYSEHLDHVHVDTF